MVKPLLFLGVPRQSASVAGLYFGSPPMRSPSSLKLRVQFTLGDDVRVSSRGSIFRLSSSPYMLGEEGKTSKAINKNRYGDCFLDQIGYNLNLLSRKLPQVILGP